MKVISDPRVSIDDLAAQARRAGRQVYLVPAADSKDQVLAAFADSLDFPAHFGHNLDALADCLGDVVDRSAAATTIIWQVSPVFRSSRAFSLISEILDDTERYSRRRHERAADEDGRASAHGELQIVMLGSPVSDEESPVNDEAAEA